MSAEPAKVAVLLAAYNGMSWIETQLESILRQERVSVSVFVSIDPSTDGTERWCALYTQRHANVTVLPPTARMGGAAKNFFRLIRDVDFSHFDYIAFSDQDDIWHSDKLYRATTRLASDGFNAYSSNVTAFWHSGRRMLLDKAQPQVKWDHLFEAAGPGCTYVLDRSLADAFKASLLTEWDRAQQVGLHDWYCYAFARNGGFRWFIDPSPSMEYRQHSGNQVGANTGAASFFVRFKNIMDGWWPAQVLLISRLIGRHSIPPIETPELKRLTFFRLIFRAQDCRRRRRDKFLFVLACLAAMIS